MSNVCEGLGQWEESHSQLLKAREELVATIEEADEEEEVLVDFSIEIRLAVASLRLGNEKVAEQRGKAGLKLLNEWFEEEAYLALDNESALGSRVNELVDFLAKKSGNKNWFELRRRHFAGYRTVAEEFELDAETETWLNEQSKSLPK